MVDAVEMLDRLPGLFRRFAYRVAAGQGLLGGLTDLLRFRYRPAEIPRLPEVDSSSRRLLIGPANSAGQGFRWARAVEAEYDNVRAIAMQGIGDGPFRPAVDLRVPVAVYQRARDWHEHFGAFLEHQTHLIWESGLPLLGRRWGSDVAKEVALMQAAGMRAALLFHGSDIRPPARHAEQNRWSPFREPAAHTHAIERTVSRNAALVETLDLPVFVSTPDLLQWVPGGMWCPVVVDPELWRSDRPIRPGGPPVVVHAPTQRWLKGTDHIEPLLRRLDAEGLIEYRQVVGVRHADMPAFYADADIVLDQFVLGIYGVAACEALAAGRLVISHVAPFTRAQVRKQTGLELPIHEATLETLETELRRAVLEPEAFAAFREDGPAFVEAIHDGRRSAEALAPFLGLSA